MTYFFAEDTKISGKWIHLISRSMDIMDQSANPSASQSVCPRQTDWLQPASQSVRLSLTDRLIFINNLFRFRRYKNMRKMDSTYITEYGYKGPASQPANQSASHVTNVLDWKTNFGQSVCLSLTYQTDWLQQVNQSVCPWQTVWLLKMTYFASEDTKISGKWFQLISQIVDLKDQPVSQPVSQSLCTWQTDWNSASKPFSQYVCPWQTDWLK